MLHTLVTRVMRVFNIRDKSGYFEMESSIKMGEWNAKKCWGGGSRVERNENW